MNSKKSTNNNAQMKCLNKLNNKYETTKTSKRIK